MEMTKERPTFADTAHELYRANIELLGWAHAILNAESPEDGEAALLAVGDRLTTWPRRAAKEIQRLRARIEELEAELAVSIERDKLWQQAEAKIAELERERDHADALLEGHQRTAERDARQFNAGWDAAQQRLSNLPSDPRALEPSLHEGPDGMTEPDEDSWGVGFAWAGYEPLAAQRDALTAQLAAAREAADSVHYWRECHSCGHAEGGYLHCMHDGYQNPCHKCGKIMLTVVGDCECEFVVEVAPIRAAMGEKETP